MFGRTRLGRRPGLQPAQSPPGRARWLWLLLGLAWAASPPSGRAAELDPAVPPLPANQLLRHGLPAVHVYTERDGLPENSIFDITTDQRGYLWVATENGAAWYNGRVWRAVKFPGDRQRGFVRDILAASDGSMWFAMDSLGLYRLREGVWKTYDRASGFPSEALARLIETRDAAGRVVVWVATQDAGLVRIDGDQIEVFGRDAGLEDLRITALLPIGGASEPDSFWIGTGSAVRRFANGRFDQAGLDSPGAPAEQVYDLAEVIAEDGSRALWVALRSGVAKLAGGRWTVGSTFGRPIALLASPGQPTQKVWVATYDAGVARLEPDGWTMFDVSTGLGSNIVRSLYEEVSPEGLRTLWIGTQGGGLARIRSQGWQALDRRHGLPSDQVAPLAATREPDGTESIWVGTNRGLARLLPSGWRVYDRKDGMPAIDITSLFAENDTPGGATLWAGSTGAIGRFHQEKWTWWTQADGVPRHFVTALARELPTLGGLVDPQRPPEARLFASSIGGGLGIFARGSWTVLDQRDGFRNSVAALFTSRSLRGAARLWLGSSRSGLSLLEDGVWHQQGTVEPAPTPAIASLLEHHVNGVHQIWIGSRGGGGPFSIDLDRPGASWVDINTLLPTPLPATVLEMRTDAKGRIYVFTTNGVARLTPRTPTAADPSQFALRLYRTDDGLPSERCNYRGALIDHSGRIWASTIRGLAFLDPAHEVEDQTAKPLYIERAEAGAGAATFASGDTLEHPHGNLVRFSLALLSTHREAETQFRTELVGFDRLPSEWGPEAGRNFTNLAAGRYLFRAWGRDWAGNVSGPVELAFTVAPAPWWTWWAWTSYLIALAALVYTVVRWRTTHLQQETSLLESRVAERTAELRASEERARAASSAKSAFLANMSHELRTPLNAILGFAQVMALEERAPRDRERLSIINRSGQHLLGMINDVLSLARIEAGRLSATNRPFDLRQLLSDLAQLMEQRAISKGLTWRAELAPDLPATVVGDDGKLRQVLLNLTGNAIKFTTAGQVTLRAAWDNGQASFEVADTGPGISRDDMTLIFEAFNQTAVGRRASEGAGLGLTIASNLVSLMGGNLTVDSELGRGSVFHVELSLPASDSDAVSPQDPVVRHLAPEELPSRVLVVDDSPENREVLAELLSAAGFIVGQAADGVEAVAAWAKDRPRVVFIDLRMPNLDGLGATREIRALEAAQPSTNRTLIVAVTASAFDHDREAPLVAGCDAVISKPCDHQVLWSLLERSGIHMVDHVQAGPAVAAHPLDATVCAELPHAVRSALIQALTRADLIEATRVVSQLPDARASVRDGLLAMIRGYRGDELLGWLESNDTTKPAS